MSPQQRVVLASCTSGASLTSLIPPESAHLGALLARYDNARDRDLRGRDRRFLIESERVLHRFLGSSWLCESILVTPKIESALAPFLATRTDAPTVFVADDATMTSISGYRLHGGALAIGERSWHPASADALLDRLPREGPLRAVVAEGVVQVDNIGTIFRNVACLGGHAVLLDADCADPLLRKTIRFSMGRVFDVPWGTSRDLRTDLDALRGLDVAVIALELAVNARSLRALPRRDRVAFVVGNEARGLSAGTLAACDDVVMIPSAVPPAAVACDVDVGGSRSLNVGVAAGIALYELLR